MKTRNQIVLGTVAVLAAAGVTIALTRDTGRAGQETMEGHDHAAMMAGMDEARPVRLTGADARRIGVSLATARRKVLDREVRALGVATYDETRLSVVNPKVSGWVEALHVDFNGAPVRRGQPLMDVYAPELVAAQEELALAARLAREAGTERARSNGDALLEAARRRLAYWDVSAETIESVERTGQVQRTVTLRSPADGVVVDKSVLEGDRVGPGMVLYRIADLSRIWLEVDVFEQDLAAVSVGQEARVRFEAFPEEALPARVTYIYPTVSLESRTGRVRLELENPVGRFRPGMYARVTLRSAAGDPVVVVPRGAVLETGERSLVFVEDADGALVPRAVTPGRTEGRETEILAGLEAGERVVTAAAFLVDAESNLGALMEMGDAADGMRGMEMDGGTAPGGRMPAGGDSMDHSNH